MPSGPAVTAGVLLGLLYGGSWLWVTLTALAYRAAVATELPEGHSLWLQVVLPSTLDALQVSALTLAPSVPWSRRSAGLRDGAQSVLLVLGGESGFELRFWILAGLLIGAMLLILAGSYFIFKMLEYEEDPQGLADTIVAYTAYFMKYFGISVLSFLVSAHACTYTNEHPEGRLDANPEMSCWSGAHLAIGLVAVVIGLPLLLTSPSLVSANNDEEHFVLSWLRGRPSDKNVIVIGWEMSESPQFLALVYPAKMLLALVVGFFGRTPEVVVTASIVFGLWVLMLLRRYRPAHPRFTAIRLGATVFGLCTAAAAAWSLAANDRDDDAPWVFMLCAWAVTAASTAVAFRRGHRLWRRALGLAAVRDPRYNHATLRTAVRDVREGARV